MTTRRPLVAALVTLCGVSITAGAVLPWVDAGGTRPASGITHTSMLGLRHLAYVPSAAAKSFAVPIAAAGILVLIGGVCAWRLLAGVFAAMALAAAGLWIALNAHHYGPTGLRYNDLRAGAWLTIAGGLVALLVAVLMRRKDASADTSPWDSVPTLADDEPDVAAPPIRRTPAWRPDPRYPLARRPPWVQDRDGFRTLR